MTLLDADAPAARQMWSRHLLFSLTPCSPITRRRHPPHLTGAETGREEPAVPRVALRRLSAVNSRTSNREKSVVAAGTTSVSKGPVFRAWSCHRFSVWPQASPLRSQTCFSAATL